MASDITMIEINIANSVFLFLLSMLSSFHLVLFCLSSSDLIHLMILIL